MVIAFTNQKGGVGKTTSAANLGVALAKDGLKILQIDFDPQSNLTSGLGKLGLSPTIYEAISSSSDVADCIHDTDRKNLYLIPSSNALSGAEVELVSQQHREFFLKNVVEKVKKDFDLIFIDCPPALGLLTINAFCAADAVIIPLQCEYYAMEGIAQLILNIKRVQKTHNSKLTVLGIILTMYDHRTNLSKEVATEIVDAFGGHVFKTIIPRNVRISESPSFGQSVLEYDRNSSGAKSYKQLSEEVKEKWKKRMQ